MIKIDPLPYWARVADILLSPLMRLVSGHPTESPQETHMWHVQRIPLSEAPTLNPGMTVSVRGREESFYKNPGGPLFHIPILGGWRKYAVFQADAAEWHVGWVGNNELCINKLLITDKNIRLLTGTPDRTTVFFAVDAKGEQIPLSVVGEGELGDPQYANVRLF